MSKAAAPRVVVTGGAGFVGRILCPRLRRSGYEVDAFDALTGDDILTLRSSLATRFRGARAVVHLAAIPHPFLPGAVDDDCHRINLLGSLNVWQAARDAEVGSFVFASSGQVYAINVLDPMRLPIREDDPVPEIGFGANLYGRLKHEVELALRAGAGTSPTISTALRLEMPGMRSTFTDNHWISTSAENLASGFVAAIEAPREADGETFNLCDPWVGLDLVDVQRYVAGRWPGVPNETIGNESIMDTAKLQRVLGWVPVRGGTYVPQPG